MNLNALILNIGSTGIFASRAFIPAFVVALALRFGHNIPILENSDFIKMATNSPSWFVSDFTIYLLGGLSLLESIATKNQELRELINSFDKNIKAIVAVVVNMGIADAADLELANTITGGMIQAGFGTYIYPIISGGGVFFLASLREEILEFISDIDPDDDLHLQGIFSIFEDCFGIFAPIMLFVLPAILILLFTGAIFATLFFIKQYLKKKEEETKIDCSCGTRIFPSAIECFNCHKIFANPANIGFFGLPNNETVSNISEHKLNLLEKKKCSYCASSLKGNNQNQSCTVCNKIAFENAEFAKAYLSRISSRLIPILIISTILSFIPILGAIIGIIYYRIKLISPLSRYMGMGQRFVIKWGLRILTFIILMFQWIPFFGGFCLPLIVIINYCFYRKSFKKNIIFPE